MPNVENVKVQLPFPATATCTIIMNTCNAQSAVIKKCPAYTSTPAVQTAVTDMDTEVTNLGTLNTQITTTRALLTTLEGKRDTQIVVVRLKHDGVETALNTASNGDPMAAAAWTGKTKSRAKPAPVSTNTDPPLNPALRNVKKHSGMVEAACTKETGVVCYAFQQGTDPLHPENWAPPVMVKGNVHKVANLPIGQVVCFRVAIVRRGSVQSQWSPVLQIQVR